MPPVALDFLPALLYFAALASGLLWIHRGGPAGRAATVFLALGALTHGIWLSWIWISRGTPPPAGRGEALALLAFATVLLHLALSLRVRERGMAPLSAALVFGYALAGALKGASPTAPAELGSLGYALHAPLFIGAFAALTMAALLALAYLLQYGQLRSRQPGPWFERFPSLESLERMGHGATVAGFLFLTAGLAVGLYVAQRLWGEAWSWDPKQCSTLLSWLLYGAVLLLRNRQGWSGPRLARANLFAFASIILGVFLVYAFFETAHRFGATG